MVQRPMRSPRIEYLPCSAATGNWRPCTCTIVGPSGRSSPGSGSREAPDRRDRDNEPAHPSTEQVVGCVPGAAAPEGAVTESNPSVSGDELTLPSRQRNDIGDGSLDSGAGPLFLRLARCLAGGRLVTWSLERSRISYGLRGEPTKFARCRAHPGRGRRPGRCTAHLRRGRRGEDGARPRGMFAGRVEGRRSVGFLPAVDAIGVPFLPLTTALRQWTADHAEPVPLLRPSGETGSSDGPFEFDCWLASLCGRRPVVLSWTTCTGRIRARWTC